MWAIVAAGARKFAGWIAAAGALVLAAVVLWTSSRRVGTAEAQTAAADTRAADREAVATRIVNEERAASAHEVETVERASDASNRNASASDADIAGRLRNWQRD